MSNKTLEGMVRVIVESMGDTPENAARDAVLWLADNVSDEMLKASLAAQTRVLNEGCTSSQTIHLECFKAALRAAAGSAPTTPEGME